MRPFRVAIVGAGIGGLVAAVRLAVAGFEVTVFEKGSAPGGKMREIRIGSHAVDSGPTVLTMRHVFEDVFAGAGANLADAVQLQPLETLARHLWTGGARLDLFTDIARSADAIGAFAGSKQARGYLAFCERARAIYETLDATFIRNSRPGMPELVHRIGPSRLGALSGISPFTTLWSALGAHFSDPRLRQLFGRYATYCGSSPFLAPATLMLVAHVEREGVWAVSGGMQRLAEALADLATARGAQFRYGAAVAEIRGARGGADGLVLATGEAIDADAVLINADPAALGAGLLGPLARTAGVQLKPGQRSLSAVTRSFVAETDGVPLAHHNVFFSDDYRAEFDAIRAGRLPPDPTVYICAQDRLPGRDAPTGPERLFSIVNAPPTGDRDSFEPTEIGQCEMRTLRRLEQCGLRVRLQPESSVATTPRDFDKLFAGTGGALYGPASHGWMASFRRPGSRTRIPRLYLAGGSVHPGPGIPMAAISGMLAASSLAHDLASTRASHRVAMPGGTSTR